MGHGHACKGKISPTFRSWSMMLTRCENPNYPEYKYWGGRGITVCERWHDFENFLLDMGKRPIARTLDRFPNKDGNYEPNNCRWATHLQQTLNRRPEGPRKRREGTRGTTFEPKRNASKPWRARIRVSGKLWLLGAYKTELAAHRAFEQAKRELANVL